jgi:hypothetical protein
MTMWKKHRLMEAARNDGGAGGGAAATGAAAGTAQPNQGAPPPGATGNQTAAPGAGDKGSAAAGAGAAAAGATADAKGTAASALSVGATGAPAGLEFIQEKYLVKTADGKVDEAASIRKQAEAYGPLVKRMGTDELPPAAATDYKIEAPKDLDPAAFEGFLKDPQTVGALDKMHKLGMTNTQANAVMGMYLEAAQMIAAGGPALTAEQTIADLRKDWKTDADLSKNVSAARHAATVLGTRVGMDFAAIEASGLANNPAFIRMMAALAPELGEDKSPNGGSLPATDLDSLVKSKAYMDASHPDHAATKAKVAAHFASLPGAGGKPKGPISVTL